MDYLSRIENKTWRAIYTVIVKVQRFIAIVACIVVPVLVVYQVFLRYVLHAPLMGIEELELFPIIWLYMIAGSVASEQRNHIECGILTLYIKKEKNMALFRIFKSFFSCAIGVYLCYWGWWYFTYSLKLWKYSDILRIPMFYAEGIIFVGFALMLFFTLIELVDHIVQFVKLCKAPAAPVEVKEAE